MNPPSAPNPAGDAGVLPEFGGLSIRDAPSPPAEEELDIMSMSRETAVKTIMRSVLSLANAAGDIPATPPLSRPRTPVTPVGKENQAGPVRHHRRTASRPATPIPAEREKTQPTELAPPEASHDEPTITHDIGAGAEPEWVQRANMARKFFSKTVPKVGLEDYVNRIQQYCPLSTGVWLAAGSYILRLCVIDKSVPLTHRTMHRLVLACLVVAMKSLEDHRWPQKRFAAVGGVDDVALSRLELCVEFLLHFDLQILSPEKMRELTVTLQKAGQAATIATRLPSSFNLRISNPKYRQAQA
ncbi:hypothetical protein BU26DRAFT_437785 [Trematosphaeria pertusa]|uniref:Cyclin-domain-containing protein n=1 Tax=Trematosphaeria pertusa TaxID=390896 RepID=A0A6A6HYC2_9PLEO|nr:uncharacterized protein BU26DRAFT_437785 [Trematosphaeria pertusa]KAF2243017.1 hypothetical protein BU26DRAFT_437785 [Trematosphaeria pertusa]